ncbi:MAG: hypothetical protein WAW17_01465, partial [Rhodococcus sp. (in: high G+C Gram-positive bacteria)]|uniref:hypothetical protein n=1 Tax=Rhodococcus sp. TaxID=1831 RepID=UPI003BB09E07
MSTIPAFQAHSTAASAMLCPDFSRQIREAQQAMTAPAVRSAQEILDRNLFQPIRETASAVLQTQEILDRNLFQPMRETASAVLRAHESVDGALSQLRL